MSCDKGPFKTSNPGNPCCCEKTPDCTLLDDAFGSDTIANYTQVAGTWTISTGSLRTTNSDAVILWATELPAAHSLFVSLLGPTSGTFQQRFIVGWKDANNYLYLRVLNGAYLSLWEVVTGTPNQLTTQVLYSTDAVDGGVSVCWLPSQNLLAYTIRPISEGAGGNLGNAHAATAGASNFGTYAGVGTGTIAVAEVSFGSLAIYSAGENCDHCFCNICDVGTTPESITIEFDGVANNDCDQCTLFNSTAFVLDRILLQACEFYHASLNLTVNCPVSDPDGNYADITGSITCKDTDTNADSYFTVRVRYFTTGIGYRNIYFQVRLGCCKLDCLAALAQGLVVPPLTVGDYADCDWTNATCTITAVA